MGKRARVKRTFEKEVARKWGYKETELGELKATVTKAEARRRFLEREMRRWGWESIIVAEASRKAAEDICRIEDERVFAELDRMAEASL